MYLPFVSAPSALIVEETLRTTIPQAGGAQRGAFMAGQILYQILGWNYETFEAQPKYYKNLFCKEKTFTMKDFTILKTIVVSEKISSF